VPGHPDDQFPGTLATAYWANQVRDQTVQPYPDAAARDAAITAPAEGQVAVTLDSDTVWLYNGAAWVPLGSYAAANNLGAWVTFEPAITVPGTSLYVSLTGSDGLLYGRWARFGRYVAVNMTATLGATSNADSLGPQVWRFVPPVPAVANNVLSGLSGVVMHAGQAFPLYHRNDNTLLFTGGNPWAPSGHDFPITGYLSSGCWLGGNDRVAPYVWAPGDFLALTGIYEAAS
jgi:hypothetical protein